MLIILMKVKSSRFNNKVILQQKKTIRFRMVFLCFLGILDKHQSKLLRHYAIFSTLASANLA